MNINYISGFFDADGSICLSSSSIKNRSVQISFHNNEKSILIEIKNYLFNNYNLKGYISRKPARKETHNDSFDLKYRCNAALKLASLLTSYHPKNYIV